MDKIINSNFWKVAHFIVTVILALAIIAFNVGGQTSDMKRDIQDLQSYRNQHINDSKLCEQAAKERDIAIVVIQKDLSFIKNSVSELKSDVKEIKNHLSKATFLASPE